MPQSHTLPDVPAKVLDVMAVNHLDRPRRDGLSLAGLRSATLRILDAAARSMGTTRAAAHASLWPQAVRLANQHRMDYTDALRLEAELTNRVIDRSQEDRYQVRHLLSDICDQHRTRTPRALVRLLAGAALWLPLLGEPGHRSLDAFAREPLPLGLLLLDALAERGLPDLCIDDDMGRAPEHIDIGLDGLILIGTDQEHVSLPPSGVTRLFLEYYDANEDPVSHEYTGAPVTSALIAAIADHAVEAARSLGLH